MRAMTAALLVTGIAVHLASPIAARAEGLPDLGDSSDASLSEPQERAIGKRIMLEIRGDRAFVEDPELRSYIDAR
jgi:predicted Zn-dependent protease